MASKVRRLRLLHVSSEKLPCVLLRVCQLMTCISLAVFVRENRSKLESAGGLTETIGRAAHGRI